MGQDPEAKAASARYNALRDELNKLNEDASASHASKKKIYSQLDEYKAQITTLMDQKRSVKDEYRGAHDRWCECVSA